MVKFGRALIALCVLLGAPFSASGVQARALDGLWRADGYGLLLEVQGNTVNAFEVTSISCIPSWQADGKTTGDGNAITFINDACERRLTLDNSPDIARLHADCSSADILFQKLKEQPKGFSEKIENTPQNTYAIFWQTYSENYPFFDLHHVDWNAVDREFRPQVTSKTSAKDLYRILRQMIEPLHDSHTGLSASDIKQGYRGSRPDPNNTGFNEFKRAYEIVAAKYVRGQIRYFCKNKLQFAMLDDSIGYLNISDFVEYADDPDFAKQLQALDSALDTIFADASKLKGLVVDVRFNSGGYDGFGIKIGSRLTRAEYLAFQVKTRDNITGPLHFSPLQAVQVPVSPRPGFAGNVVLLVGRNTVSAGEVFAMSLFGRKPSITRIGENTQGVFSDVLGRKLPNGWTFTLPNQIYLTEDGRSFDGTGVPADISVPVLAREDLQAGHDSAIERALEVLRGRGQP
jgi:hypothetical protein